MYKQCKHEFMQTNIYTEGSMYAEKKVFVFWSKKYKCVSKQRAIYFS